MPEHHYRQQGSIDEHLHHIHRPRQSQGGARGGGWNEFWNGVGDFFVHTVPDVIIPAVGHAVMAAI